MINNIALVGSFETHNMNRHEVEFEYAFKTDFNKQVFRVPYKNFNPTSLFTYIARLHQQVNIDLVLICGGKYIDPSQLDHFSKQNPTIKIVNWYHDCHSHNVIEWFKHLCSFCDHSFLTTGDTTLLNSYLTKKQKPCTYLPTPPDHRYYYPIPNIKKQIDVSFFCTPYPNRINLVDYLVKNGINIQVFSRSAISDWPNRLHSFVRGPVYNQQFNIALNSSKIVINSNIINTVPLYFSDRYFYPMATKSVGLNKYVPNLEDMFEDGKHMVFWENNEDCLEKIKLLLNNKTKCKQIEENGYELYKEKYSLKHITTKLLKEVKTT